MVTPALRFETRRKLGPPPSRSKWVTDGDSIRTPLGPTGPAVEILRPSFISASCSVSSLSLLTSRFLCYSCREKYNGYVKHCLDFQLTECSAICNATTPASIATCQQALQKVCNTVTSPTGIRLLGEEAGDVSKPVQLMHRELADPVCATSQSLLLAIASGTPLILVSCTAGGRVYECIV